eukprot:TRINITY_DN67135_c1_g5_i2.p1 TRINITY_DN67135_c1_g5~~TRINITY_DN67135_c1_g5_i2.p1  ORF type:complete len:161 (+),score=11.73 TRINITY_DN67135_c1_g5_i2:53-535(+)
MSVPKIHQHTCEINGHKTEFLACVYAENISYWVTQYGKPGTVIHARRDCGIEELDATAPSFEVQTLMGKRDDMIAMLVARQLIQWIHVTCKAKADLVLSCAMKPVNEDNMKAVITAILEHCKALLTPPTQPAIPAEPQHVGSSFPTQPTQQAEVADDEVL